MLHVVKQFIVVFSAPQPVQLTQNIMATPLLDQNNTPNTIVSYGITLGGTWSNLIKMKDKKERMLIMITCNDIITIYKRFFIPMFSCMNSYAHKAYWHIIGSGNGLSPI